jgi:membrane fusion protein (multidrug efflux system)
MTDLALAKSAVSAGGRARRRERRWLRPALIAFGPIVLVLVGAYLYLSGGRYIATDNA